MARAKQAPMGELQGWISNFFEQGMEEPAWHIFQDQEYVGDTPGSWRREGMHRLGEGDRLTILDPAGTVLWSGTLQGRRSGWFGRLSAGSSDWHPEDLEKEQWVGFFRREPPLRARYTPATGSGSE